MTVHATPSCIRSILRDDSVDIDGFLIGPCRWGRLLPSRLRSFASPAGLEWDSYSTSRFLGDAGSEILGTIPRGGIARSSAINIEVLPRNTCKDFESLGLQFASREEILRLQVPDALQDALHLIAEVQQLHDSVAGICRSLHVLCSGDRKIDISFSDPNIPFSIFVSCPSPSDEFRIERLTESVLHEVLHLQLSLVEKVEPLVDASNQNTLVYSPWKEERRTVGGLLHAVYVFANLRYFWKRIVYGVPQRSSFAGQRVSLISAELREASHLGSCQGLTRRGRSLAGSLLR